MLQGGTTESSYYLCIPTRTKVLARKREQRPPCGATASLGEKGLSHAVGCVDNPTHGPNPGHAVGESAKMELG